MAVELERAEETVRILVSRFLKQESNARQRAVNAALGFGHNQMSVELAFGFVPTASSSRSKPNCKVYVLCQRPKGSPSSRVITAAVAKYLRSEFKLGEPDVVVDAQSGLFKSLAMPDPEIASLLNGPNPVLTPGVRIRSAVRRAALGFFACEKDAGRPPAEVSDIPLFDREEPFRNAEASIPIAVDGSVPRNPSRVFGVTVAHMFDRNAPAVGQDVWQPNPHGRVVGSITAPTFLRPRDRRQSWDVAAFELGDPNHIKQALLQSTHKSFQMTAPIISGTFPVADGTEVYKLGPSSGGTVGKVKAVGVFAQYGFEIDPDNPETCESAILVQGLPVPFAIGGDSGSPVVVPRDGNALLGMVLGGLASHGRADTIVAPIEPLLAALRLGLIL